MQSLQVFLHLIEFCLFAELSPSLQSVLQMAGVGEIPPMKIISLKVIMASINHAQNPCKGHSKPVSASKDAIICISSDEFTHGKEDVSLMLFVWGSNAANRASPVKIAVLNMEVRWFQDERSMLLGWLSWTLEKNPDIFYVFEVGSPED